MKKRSTIKINQFKNGSQGMVNEIGTVQRLIKNRKFYVPSFGGCVSSKMYWQKFRTVCIFGTDYVLPDDNEITLSSTDKLPRDLCPIGLCRV